MGVSPYGLTPRRGREDALYGVAKLALLYME